jgi:hypothetical protein
MPVTVKKTSNFKLSLEQREDGSWQCACSLGFVICGSNLDEIKTKIDNIVEGLVDYLNERGGIDAVRDRLSRGGIEITVEAQTPLEQISSRIQSELEKVLEPA